MAVMDYTKLSNFELESLFLGEGDMDALAFYFYKTRPLLAYIGRCFRLEDHAIDDLMADTRLFAVQKLHVLEPGHLCKWLCETMKRKCLNHLKRSRVRAKYEQRIKREQTNRTGSVESASEVNMDLVNAFMELSEIDRNIILFQLLEGKTAEETAALLQVSSRTVERHRKRLKERFDKLCR